ncbi:MAG: hypothetical protein BEN19_01895 [Epulopiscium sp. Nuni2H_MBin003]|nr:MAG: hypothetical protein BEN19_01895 [Epulopiscium sp. Nuni2H_MBin003]
MTKREHYAQVLKQFDAKRIHNLKLQKQRTEKIYKLIPQIEDLDEKLRLNGLDLVKNMLESHGTTRGEKNFKKRNQELLSLKNNLLIQNGYKSNYLDLTYNCSKCKDEGFLDNNTPCICFKQALINLAYKQSNLSHLLQTENFDTFNSELYSNEKSSDDGVSPRRQIEYIKQQSIFFIDAFDVKYQNLIFQGESGVGKTFLCNCIAKTLLDIGKTVLYLSAGQFFTLFEDMRFNRTKLDMQSKLTLDAVFTCDLLIIDDLGSEFGTTFTGPDLFNIINSRHLNLKPTIISTNLSTDDLQNFYSERVASRLLGNYVLYKFLGADLRLSQKYQQRL